MNNIVQYQYEGNVSLIYSILKRKEVFENLAKLSLPAAIREANHQQNRERGQQQDAPVASAAEKKKSSGMFGASKPKPTNKEEEGALASPPIQSTGLVDTHNVIQSAGVEKPVDVVVLSSSSLPNPTTVSSTEGNHDGATIESNAPEGSNTNEISSSSAVSLNGALNEAVLSPAEAASASSSVDNEMTVEKSSGAQSQSQPLSEASVDANGKATAQKSPARPTTAPTPTRPRWVPSEEWLAAVKAELPLLTIMRLLRYLGPLVEEFTKSSATDELQVMDLIRKTTMVGLLPVPHPIVIRKYQANRYTSLWFTAYQWGAIFMYSQRTLPLFEGKAVRLFTVQAAAV